MVIPKTYKGTTYSENLGQVVNQIGNYTFNSLNNASFYYTGTSAEWEGLQNSIGSNNNSLTNATVICNYTE